LDLATLTFGNKIEVKWFFFCYGWHGVHGLFFATDDAESTDYVFWKSAMFSSHLGMKCG
jgi:hypothetical protein